MTNHHEAAAGNLNNAGGDIDGLFAVLILVIRLPSERTSLGTEDAEFMTEQEDDCRDRAGQKL